MLFCREVSPGVSPPTKISPSLDYVWAPAHPFFLLEKFVSSVRIPTQAVSPDRYAGNFSAYSRSTGFPFFRFSKSSKIWENLFESRTKAPRAFSPRHEKNGLSRFFLLSGRRDSNPESLVPKTSMLAVTPRPDVSICPDILAYKNFF